MVRLQRNTDLTSGESTTMGIAAGAEKATPRKVVIADLAWADSLQTPLCAPECKSDSFADQTDDL